MHIQNDFSRLPFADLFKPFRERRKRIAMGDQQFRVRFPIQDRSGNRFVCQIFLPLHRPLNKPESKIPAASKRKRQLVACTQSVNCNKPILAQKTASLRNRLRRTNRIDEQRHLSAEPRLYLLQLTGCRKI